MFAVSREVQLDDEAWDVFTVANPVQGWSQREVVEVHRMFHRTHCQKAVVRAEPEPQDQRVCREPRFLINQTQETKLYRMSWMATLRSLFLPQTVRELTSRMMNSPFSMPMETISPLAL